MSRAIAVAITGFLLLVAPTADARGEHVFRTAGIVLRYPTGWYATGRPFNAWTNPVQRFVLSSDPIPGDRPNLDGNYSPPPGDVITLFVEEQAPGPDLRSFRVRPRHLKLPRLSDHLEGFGDRWAETGYREGDRVFIIFIGVGADTPAGRVTALLHLLDDLSIK
jgi:hypothetical protein